MTIDSMLPFLIGILLTALIIISAISISKYMKKNDLEENFQAQARDLLSGIDGDEEEYMQGSTKVSLADRWNRGWAKTFKAAGVARYKDNAERAGTDMLILSVTVMIALGIIFMNPIVGILAGVLTVSIIGMILRSMANKKIEKIDEQLFGFLFSFKARVQSGETNEQAFLSIVNTTKDPLFSELVEARDDIMASKGFSNSLEVLRERTPSRDLQFLASCLIQASKSGAPMEQQLEKIQDVMRSRRDVNDEIAIAMKEPQPAIWLSSAIIPALFVYSYLSTPEEFWFVNPISWVALLAVGILYFIGMYVMRKMVDKIKNL